MKKKPFFTSSETLYIKYRNNTNHWVINSLMKNIDVYESFNRKVIISVLEASFNDYDVIDASVVTEVKTETAVFVEVS